MTCDYDQTKIERLLDGTLTPSEEAELRIHLETCPECAERERQLREVTEFFGSMEEPDVPPELHGHIMSALPWERKKRMFERRWVKMLAAAAACALLALVFVRLPRQMKYSSLADEAESGQGVYFAPEESPALSAGESALPEDKSFKTESFAAAGEDFNGIRAEAAMVPAYAVSYVYAGDVKALNPDTDFEGSVYFEQTDGGAAVIVETGSDAESALLGRLAALGFEKTDETVKTLCPGFAQDDSMPYTLYYLRVN